MAGNRWLYRRQSRRSAWLRASLRQQGMKISFVLFRHFAAVVIASGQEIDGIVEPDGVGHSRSRRERRFVRLRRRSAAIAGGQQKNDNGQNAHGQSAVSKVSQVRMCFEGE